MNLNLARVNVKQPVFSKILPNHEMLNQHLRALIENYRTSNPSSNKTNIKSWHTTYMLHHEEHKFLPFIEHVYDYVKSITKEYYYWTEEIDFACTNFWAAMYEKNDFCLKHAHFPSIFSAVYYVDVEPDASPIIFGGNIQVKPENGMLLIFPGDLFHEVPKTKGERIVLAMNFEKLPSKSLMEELITYHQPNYRSNIDPDPQDEVQHPEYTGAPW
tara:strand:+ start:1338 stop:1982 length:645 start_codon:yes stop_codon:yes gene_type:complete